MKYTVTLQRIVYYKDIITVDAENIHEAEGKAEFELESMPMDGRTFEDIEGFVSVEENPEEEEEYDEMGFKRTVPPQPDDHAALSS